ARRDVLDVGLRARVTCGEGQFDDAARCDRPRLRGNGRIQRISDVACGVDRIARVDPQPRPRLLCDPVEECRVRAAKESDAGELSGDVLACHGATLEAAETVANPPFRRAKAAL